MIAKVNKTKSWFFVNINKIDKSSARLSKEKKKGTELKSIKLQIKKGEITMDSTEIQKIVRYY